MSSTLFDGIDWVGVVDWNVRDFHGYKTQRGSTYNAYLIRDEKTALFDTVKCPFSEKLLANVRALTPLEKLDYLVVHHGEPDHAGSASAVVKACPQVTVVCSERVQKTLSAYQDTTGWNWQLVKTGDTLSLGTHTLSFLETPMVHWPDSTMTYVPERKLLFCMDAFGQHYASSGRFDDEVVLHEALDEARTYYANIIMWAGKPIQRALEAASQLDIEMLATGHGVIWRSHVAEIIAAYQDWVVCRPRPKVLVAYDTMWESTAAMAEAIAEGARSTGVDVKLFSVRANDITRLATEVLDAATMAFGSSTLNGGMLPAMAEGLTYIQGLRPLCKAGFAFGSYGWSKGGAARVNQYLEDTKIEVLREPLECPYRPTPEVLAECREAGKLLGERATALACAAEQPAER